jgi:phospholipid/cholesterol/gamma-HCH transport system substrate-binding protein
MENRAHALLAGLFTLTLLVTAVLMGIWLNRDRIERVPYEIATKLPVPGLNSQAAVRYRGLDVGKVESITFDPSVPGQILIHISVSKETPVTQSTYAFLGYQGVTGIAYVQMDDDESKPDKLSSSRKQVTRIEMRPGLLDKIQTRGLAILEETEMLAKRFNTMFNEPNQKKILNAFEDVSQAANRVSTIPKKLDGPLAKITDAADRLGSTVSNVEHGTLPHVNALTNEVRSTVRSLDRTVEQLGQNPQSILFGPPPMQPGPGEPGFVVPSK